MNTKCFLFYFLQQLLTIAVLSIIVTAPIGAIAISLAGPVLLEKSEPAALASPVIDVSRDQSPDFIAMTTKVSTTTPVDHEELKTDPV